MTNVLLRLVRGESGEAAVAALLERAGTKREAYYLENVDNWISLDEACTLLEAGALETGDETIAGRVGESTLRRHAGTQIATLLRSLGSVEGILEAVAQTAAKFSTVTELTAVEVDPGHAVISAVAREGFTRRSVLCEWTAGLLSAAPELFGLPLARVEETECQAHGGGQCLYTVSWDAELAAVAADPQQRVTALEAQLASVSQRLQSAYATASDLVSTEDLDTVLHRIVEHAANAVRAPGFVLAVSPQPGAELQVYSHGIDGREAAALAHATLEQRRPGRRLDAGRRGHIEPAPLRAADRPLPRRDPVLPAGPGGARSLRQARRRGAGYGHGAAGVRPAPRPGELAALALPCPGAGGDERGDRRTPCGGGPRSRGLRPHGRLGVG